MTPILYGSKETEFKSNGLGRLYDCISCVVTEERNGIYECDFEYPINGINYDRIQLGRIIAVTHDDAGDIQPFDIVSRSNPINGIVKFHAVHISYRLNKATCYYNGTSVNSWRVMVGVLYGYTYPDISRFRFRSIDADSFQGIRIGAFDGTPRAVRQILGGVEGSFLDTYGGEFVFDKWSVDFKRARGERKDISIRYGLNLADYNEDIDYSQTFTKCRPFWKGNAIEDEIIVVGDVVSSGASAYNGLNNCVPLDLSDKFEDKPTKAQLREQALKEMARQKPYLPERNITVDFVRLQDSPEYAEYESLLTCKLCDYINVVFPAYGVNEAFKIVRVEWDALKERFIKMELGDLQTSLSEALGLNESETPNGGQLTRTTHVIFADGSQTISNYWYSTFTATKNGFIPLGIVGHKIAGTNSRYMSLASCFIESASNGSAVVRYTLKNNGSDPWAGEFAVDILWSKL